MPSRPVSRLGVGLALGLGLLLSACAQDGPSVRMKTETTDATRSACRRACDQDRQACLHQKRDEGERQEVDGPSEVSKGEWQELYKQAQELARTCDEAHRKCEAGCLE